MFTNQHLGVCERREQAVGKQLPREVFTMGYICKLYFLELKHLGSGGNMMYTSCAKLRQNSKHWADNE